MNICYIFPSRSRPDKFFSVLDNIKNLSAKEDYSIIISLDIDDESMCNIDVMNRISSYKNIAATVYKTSTGKVNVINRDVNLIPEDTDIIILMSDDMVFTQWGFDDIIRTDMQKYFNNFDGVLHYPDGTPVKDKIITMSIMGYKYFKRFGYLYHPEYTSLWCDLEFTEVAKKLGKYKYLPNTNILIHAHSVWSGGKEKYDALMTRNESFYHKDKEIYFKRLERNFDLKL
jgi:hypothetical protein